MAGDGAAYVLTKDPDGTSWTARENLTDILTRELLGPADGETELIGVAPDTRYLLGRIAPTRISRGPEAPSVGSDDDSTADIGDDLEARESRGVPMTAVDDSSVDADEDSTGGREDDPIKRGLMIPASMGLRFQVPLDLDRVRVRASWGVYNPEKTGETTALGRAITHFRRTPVETAADLVFDQITPGTTEEFVLKDEVILRVDLYEDTEMGRRLVEIALCNDQETPRRIPVNAWLFQTKLYVEAEGAAQFMPVRDALTDMRHEPDGELRRLALQYRDRLEFAVGRTCSVAWSEPEERRTSKVWTTWLPTSETPQTRALDLKGVSLDMRVLARASEQEIDAVLRPIFEGYAEWLRSQRRLVWTLPTHLQEEAREAVDEAALVSEQLAEGLGFLVGTADRAPNEEALRCFRFMNQVMADQRVHSQIAQERAKDPTLDLASATALVAARGADAHSWFTFQIAFILMQIPAMCRPDLPRRSGAVAKVELLFFPTGGGKTEAYLGLAAFTFAIRRRQGVIDTPDGALDGGAGVAVLMRYTLRLLTSQQFQRATTLVCAAELARAEDPQTWGAEPFRIGLWVGTDVSPKRVKEADEQLKRVNAGHGHRLTVLQINRCPWCGTPIDSSDVRVDRAEGRVRVRCGDDLATCPFSPGGSVDDGLPVLTVDEEIYRLVPAFVIATVDKFARLAREGQAAALFGYVAKRCDRHGFVHPDDDQCQIKDGSKHPAKNGLPAAPVRATRRLRPPDLIIQDELHLITGALGTAVGLFEVAIDAVTTWRTTSGDVAKPLIVASTATVRNATDQIRGLYGRRVTVFPPRVLDAGETFFSHEVPVTPQTPGRRYVGVSTTGVRLTTAEIRIAEVLLASGQLLLDRDGASADPYLTLVGYFNATRELAGMARYVQDDVQTALAKGRPWSALPRRYGTAYGRIHLDELTSRVSSADITTTLDQMGVPFDPALDSTEGRDRQREARARGQTAASRKADPFDVVLATSMLQVGVDVTRLGLMLMIGQPRNTAEYIQASSRVGREAARPGLVVTLGNWARPRDLAHYESFGHFHETFYAQVEALSVTPFSVTSMERSLDGVLVSAARVLQATVAHGLSPERSAGRVLQHHEMLSRLVDALSARVLRASDEDAGKRARERLVNRLDLWEKRRQTVGQRGLNLAYERIGDTSTYAPLIRSAESVRAGSTAVDDAPFVIANSMREVQPEINILVSPIEERLFYQEPVLAPQWQPPTEGNDS